MLFLAQKNYSHFLISHDFKARLAILGQPPFPLYHAIAFGLTILVSTYIICTLVRTQFIHLHSRVLYNSSRASWQGKNSIHDIYLVLYIKYWKPHNSCFMMRRAEREYVSQDHVTSNKLPAAHPAFVKPSFPWDLSTWPTPLPFSTFLCAVLFPNGILVFLISVGSIQGPCCIFTVLSERAYSRCWMDTGWLIFYVYVCWCPVLNVRLF